MNYIPNQVAKENGTDDTKTKSTPVAMVAPEVKQNSDDTEITKTCAVSGCEDYKTLDSNSFFKFPDDPTLRQIWAELTGRHDWTPNDYSYICEQHFSADSFQLDDEGFMVLSSKAVPSVKLPGHVFEVEYIDEETLENDTIENGNNDYNEMQYEEEEDQSSEEKVELLKLFTEVQKMQRVAVGLKDKLKCNMKLHNQQAKYLQRLKDTVAIKEKVLNQKKKKKSRILLSIQDKIKEDTNGLVLAMPVRHSDDLKNFALSIYRYSPQAYIYTRNTLRTMLPSTDVLDSWIKAGYHPRNVITNSNFVKVIAEQTESELSCKVQLS